MDTLNFTSERDGCSATAQQQQSRKFQRRGSFLLLRHHLVSCFSSNPEPSYSCFSSQTTKQNMSNWHWKTLNLKPWAESWLTEEALKVDSERLKITRLEEAEGDCELGM